MALPFAALAGSYGMKRITSLACSSLAVLGLAALPVKAHEVTAQQAAEALRKAVHFFRTEASASGAYVYRWSDDLSRREGEGKVGPTTGWVEPPATPSVGRAYLQAFQLTRDPLLLEAAVETGMALVRTQLVSGGWYSNLEFDPVVRQQYAYRVDRHETAARLRNMTTFDDDKTQSAMRFLMRLDHVLEHGHPSIHEAALYALDAAVKAQYPNGAWPQQYDRFPDPQQFPVRSARYPDAWPREFPQRPYHDDYTLNDNTISDLIRTLLDAYEIYGDARFRQAALRGGDFFIAAQMPEPQPGWAQQYDRQMQPSWARRFEPPAITGGEAQGVMESLIGLFDRTGEERFLQPLAKALDYYSQCQLPDGRLARFYELRTNRPLFFTRDYRLTYASDDLPTHYAFLVGSRLTAIRQQYERARTQGPQPHAAALEPARPHRTESLTRQAAAIVAALDDRGAWVEPGRLRYHGADDATRQILDARTFARHIVQLARFIAAE